MLGGSSGINYLMYVRGSRKDYDGWRDLGNEGWGWDDLVPYFKKHQNLDLPSDKVKGLGQTYNAKATREVVLCAGVVQTPQVLELSGIGNREVLSAAGINTIVESPSVGANFQDHVLGGTVFECAPDITSLNALHGDEYGQKQQMIYEKEHTRPFGSPGMLMGFISYVSLVSEEELQDKIAEIKKNSLAKTAFEKKQEQLIIDQLSDPTFANLQTFLIPANMDLTACRDQTKYLGPPPKGKNRVAPLICLEHPLSRGSIHITSSDPTKPPRIDPGYLCNEVDAKILAARRK